MPTVSTPSSTPERTTELAAVGAAEAAGAAEAELPQAVMDRTMSRDRITDTNFFILGSTFLFCIKK